MRFNRESKTPTDFSLNISPWCQTLSKALDISKTHHKFQELGKHQRLCINYQQLIIGDLHMSC